MEVVQRFGEPAVQLRNDGILCYRLAGDAERGYAIMLPRMLSSLADDHAVRYSLVLTFDGNGILLRHALVPVR